MVIIDDRDGSRELAFSDTLRSMCDLQRLEFGDVMLTGHGPVGQISVGVEVKSVHDLLSSLDTGRLQGHQLPGMFKTYDQSWLLIYGYARASESNHLELRSNRGTWYTYKMGPRPMPWSYIEGWLLTAQMLTPLRIKWVANKEEAAKWIAVLDGWLAKPWEKHKGMQAFNRSGDVAAPPGADPTEAQMAKVAAALPGVGWTRGWAAARHFTSIESMINAPASEWEQIPKFGPVLSKSVRRTIRRTK